MMMMMMMMINDRTLFSQIIRLEFFIREANTMVGFYFSSLVSIYVQRGYCNWGHLDKADQSDCLKLTIHSKKVCCGQISRS